MPITQHQPKDIKRYNKGANRDVDEELIGSMSDGVYLDSSNMRPLSMDGHAGALEKIKGEEILHRNKKSLCIDGDETAQTGNFVCMGDIEVNDHIVEFWAERSGAEYPLIRIDGDIVARSPDLTISADAPLQMDKNESCIGVEIYDCDNKTPLLIFNIQQLLEHTCEEKFFSE